MTTTQGNLKRRFVNAAGWTIAGHALAQVLRFGSNLVLTRLLAPEMFGVMAVGYMVFTGFVMLSDMGTFGLVSKSVRGEEPRFLNVVWVVQIVRGAIIAVLALALSGLLTLGPVRGLFPEHSVYADPRVPGVIAVLALHPLLSGFESTKCWFVRRNMLLKSLTKIELWSQLATTIFIVSWALISPTIWALALGWVFGMAVKTVLSHTALPGPSNRLEWEGEAFHEIITFGRWAMVSSVFTFVLGSGDRILLGAYLDAKDMGSYSIALLLITALQDVVLRITGVAALPAFSEVVRERPEDLKKVVYRLRRLLDVACFVPAGMLLMLGGDIIGILYDTRYAMAGWMLTLLALTLISTPYNTFDQCLVAMGRMKVLSALNGCRLVTLYTFVPLGYWLYGANGAIVALPCASLVNTGILIAVQARLGLLDARRELLGIPLFGFGALAGWLGALTIAWLRAHV